MGKWLMIVGAAVLLLGVALHFVPGLFGWFGKLPGDIRIESGRSRVFIPITSMLLISIVASVLLNLFRR
ncbi:DUF2905 domain-containing protein [Stutzerimonas azotifigens]|uniref:DUF2905 domain-containing protein n=1 Tax=Stutzerimonas azotifigens TaxID=291995 RepID=UPI0003F6E5EE|nr:DUF2905 domain-containing protein [Stutzerimonas azotifigens]